MDFQLSSAADFDFIRVRFVDVCLVETDVILSLAMIALDLASLCFDLTL